MGATDQHSHTVSVNGLKIHYWESRPHLPQTIVMLRGFRSSDQGLMRFAREFDGYHVIIPDFPGYGRTAELDVEHSVQAYAEVMEGFIEQLGIHDLTLLGHSFGAQVALACTARHSRHIGHLVLISPVPKPSLLLRLTSLYYIIGRTLPPPLGRSWLTSRVIQNPVRQYVTQTSDPVIRAEVMAEGEQELKELKPNINVENFLSVARGDPTGWIGRLKVPTFVIVGDKDRLTNVRDVVNTYDCPVISVKIARGLGHYAPSENPAELAEVVKSWLRQQLTVVHAK